MTRDATSGGTSSRGPDDDPASCPLRADGLRGSALPALHDGNDGEAEGDRAHHGRLSRRRRDDAPLHLRRQARLGLLVRRRHRLGNRATATSSTGRSATARPASSTRARPNYPNQDRWWEIVERYKVDILYTAPTAIRAHMKWGPEHAQKHDLSSLRLLGTRRRADQPGGVGLVPRAHRRRPTADRRHVVADGDRDDPDHPAAGCDDDEAGLGHEAVPGRRAPPCTARRARRSAQAAAATWSRSGPGRRCCAGSTRTTSASARRTGPGTTTSTSRATARASTRTVTTGCSDAWTT